MSTKHYGALHREIASESMARAPAQSRPTPGKPSNKPPIISTNGKRRTKSGFTIYIDDDTPPPETGLGTPSKNTKPLASSSDYGGSSNNEDLIAAAGQVELMRSWVDRGIQMAMKELEDERLGNRKEDFAEAPFPKSNQPPQTPTSHTFQQTAAYIAPSQSQNSHPKYYSHVPRYQSMGTPQGYQRHPAASLPQFYTPQQGMAHAPQLSPQNISRYPP